MSTTFTRIPVSDLPVGIALRSPIFDPENPGAKLLGDGIKITEPLLKQLSTRGVGFVSVNKRDLAAIHAGVPQGVRREVSDHQYPVSSLITEHSREIENDLKTQNLNPDLAPDRNHEVVDLGDTPEGQYDSDARAREVMSREQMVENVEDLFDKIVKGSVTDSNALTDVGLDSLHSIVRDKDLFLFLAANPYSSDYPARHCLHVCAIATAIGAVLGLDDKNLMDVGTGCLIHDVGMLKLYRPLHDLKRRLNSSELKHLADHPILAFDAMNSSGILLPPRARIVAYQIHERGDGSGYPRGWTNDKIHGLAKIASVADVFVGLVTNRPDRRGMIPYFAVKKILESIPLGLYDARVVRGLINAISLFPIGSFVETNTGRIGRVVRATGETYMQPIIELWNEKDQEYEPDLLNLAGDSSVRITGPSLSPRSQH